MLDSELTITNLIILISTVATPIILLVISAIGWYLKSRIETSQRADEELRQRELRIEEDIRADRLQTYNAILEPFIILFWNEIDAPKRRGSSKKSKQERAEEIMLSLEYRHAAFKLSLFANDDVIRAYNNLMQLSFKIENSPQPVSVDEPLGNAARMLDAFGNLLLEIRKSVGNETTSLSNYEMLEWMIKDIDRLRG